MSTKILEINKKNFFIDKSIKKLRENSGFSLEQTAKNISVNFETFKNYEHLNISPPLKTLIKLSNFFGVSIDFLLLLDKTKYPHNIKLMSLSKEFDKIDQMKRFQIENTTNSLLKNKKNINDIYMKSDENINFDLSNNICQNIKTIRETKQLSQQYVSDNLNTEQSVISRYEKERIPPVEKLIKLSELFNISIHALATGEKLYYDFQDRQFGRTMLLADQLLTLEEHKMLIYLMETIINNN